MSRVDENPKVERAIDALVIVHAYLYFMEKSKLQLEVLAEHALKGIIADSTRKGILAGVLVGLSREGVLRELSRERCTLQLVSQRIAYYARRTAAAGGLDEETRTEIISRDINRHLKMKKCGCCSAGDTEDDDMDKGEDEGGDGDEQRPLKIRRRDRPIDLDEVVEGMCACKLEDLHMKKIKALLVYDPKRKLNVPSRFCSFYPFDIDEESTAPLGPRYQRPHPLPPGTSWTNYVAENTDYDLASYSTEVVSIRVVRAGPDYTYPVEVYGTVIARDEVDYKCVYLFNRERKDAQTIKTEKDMLALTGPYRPLVTLGQMYFEFDLKVKGKGGPDDDEQFSQGVIEDWWKPDFKRVILQLPSFQSTVKLVLQHVKLPVAAILQVSVFDKEPSDPLVHFVGKITAGTTRNYRQHMLLYDSSVRSGDLVAENGSLLLNRNVVSVCGFVEGLAYKKEELVLYVCFLDASCEIKDTDKTYPEQEDYEEEKERVKVKVKEEEEEEEGDPKNVVTLKYPQSETVWEHGCRRKLKVKVDWTAVLNKPMSCTISRFPEDYLLDYRYGPPIEWQ